MKSQAHLLLEQEVGVVDILVILVVVAQVAVEMEQDLAQHLEQQEQQILVAAVEVVIKIMGLLAVKE